MGEEEKGAVGAVGGGKHARQADSSEDEYEQEDGGLADTRTPNQKHFDDMKRKRLKKDIGHWTAKTHREKINVRFGRTGGAGENRRMRGAAWRARRWWCVWCVCVVWMLLAARGALHRGTNSISIYVVRIERLRTSLTVLYRLSALTTHTHACRISMPDLRPCLSTTTYPRLRTLVSVKTYRRSFHDMAGTMVTG